MTNKELAAAIRRGHGMIRECRDTYLNTSNDCGCAIGAAIVGIGKTYQDYSFQDVVNDFSDFLGISRKLAIDISTKHSNGITRLAIADWLDTLDAPVTDKAFTDFMATLTTRKPATGEYDGVPVRLPVTRGETV